MLFFNALEMFFHLVLPILGAILCGGILAGIFQALTQIQDRVIGLAAKLSSFGLACYLFSGEIARSFTEFTTRIWGGADLYR